MRLAPSCGIALCAVLSATVCWSESLPTLPSSKVTVVLDSDRSLSPESFRAMENELSNILSDSNIRVSIRVRTDLADHEQFGDLVLFRMRGQCSMRAMPVGALSDERGPLAWTHISNGEMLPFGEVECDRLRQSVQRAFGRGNPERREPQLGIAMARVMAHEMYHMFARSNSHTHSGLTKPALSPEELTEGKLSLDPTAKRSVARSTEK